MKIIKLLCGGVVLVLLISCGTSKLASTGKTDASTLEAVGNFKEAMNAWAGYFSGIQNDDVAGADFAHAAKTAFKAGNHAQAISWFDQARYKSYSDAEMYKTLAKIYEADDNLSKELSALEFYTENFGDTDAEINSRLFELYSEIDSNEKAFEMWSKMNSESQNTESNLEKYFKLNSVLENDAVCDSVSKVLLEKNPQNITALTWFAKKYYWAGQNRYETEMEKYNQNKTRKNYNALLKQLDLVTADFKKALPYLDKLWKLQPGKEYAGYLANIYARFGDETKTNYYKKFMK